jgi:hypothetical protein
MSEPETIEAEVEEIMDNLPEPGGLPAVRGTAAINLFHTQDPVEVVRRATETAEALAKVLRDQELVVNISNREHVRVEGWTLLGSMLGVFPVVEWTRPVEDGWEARVEARTLAGAVVGAAEAQCLRSEKEWGPNPTRGKPKDDYALRSMAQTRATSKAMRHPLGFVVSLAGFDPTPAEEMPRDAAEARVEGPEPLRAPTSWAKITEMVGAYDEGTYKLFMRFGESARRLLYPGSVDVKSLSTEEKNALGKLTGLAALALRNAVDSTAFPPPTEDDIRAAWASVLEGQELQPAPIEEGEGE